MLIVLWNLVKFFIDMFCGLVSAGDSNYCWIFISAHYPCKCLVKRSAEIFLTRKLSRALNKAQITYALSLFISSGYDLQEAMKFVPKLVDDKQLRANLENAMKIS